MTPNAFDFDICVPVSSPISAVGRVKFWQRPALKVVRTLYHGSYEGLGGAWYEFGKWTEANGYKTAGDLYECFSAIDLMVIGKIRPCLAVAPLSGEIIGANDGPRGQKRVRQPGGLADYLATG